MRIANRKTPAERLIFPASHLWVPTVRMSRRKCCCGGIKCGECDVPENITVNCPGGWTTWNCSQCVEWSTGPFVLTWRGNISGFCTWSYDGTCTGGGGTYNFMAVVTIPSTFGTLQLQVSDFGGSAGAWWRKQITGCDGLTGTQTLNLFLDNMNVYCHSGITGSATITF